MVHRMSNGDEVPAEIYYSNGGEMNLNTNKILGRGGLTESFAKEMDMKANILQDMDLVDTYAKIDSSANAGGDEYTSAHVRNWMECVRSRR